MAVGLLIERFRINVLRSDKFSYPGAGFFFGISFEYATKIPKRNKVFNLDLEMHAGFNADFFSGKLDEAAFRFRDVKIDVTGEVNDRLFYWYRQTLNGGYEGQALENLNESIEYAYIGYKLNERFTLTAGNKMCSTVVLSTTRILCLFMSIAI